MVSKSSQGGLSSSWKLDLSGGRTQAHPEEEDAPPSCIDGDAIVSGVEACTIRRTLHWNATCLTEAHGSPFHAAGTNYCSIT